MQQERCAGREAWDLAKHIYKLKNADKATFYTPIEARLLPAPTSKRPEEREFVVDSGTSLHMLSKKELSYWILCEDPGTPLRCLQPMEKEVHTNEEAQVYVHDLNPFVTVQLLEETPAVLSLGKLSYSYERVIGQKPRLTKEGKTIVCKTDNFVPLVVPGVIHQFWK